MKRLPFLLLLLILLAAPVQGTIYIETDTEYIGIDFNEDVIIEGSTNITFTNVTFINTTVINFSSKDIQVITSVVNTSILEVAGNNSKFTLTNFDRGISSTLSITTSGENNSWVNSTFRNITFSESGTLNTCENGSYRGTTDYGGSAGCAPPNVSIVFAPLGPYFHDQAATIEIGCSDQTLVASGGFTSVDPEGVPTTIIASVLNSTALRGSVSANNVAGVHNLTSVFCIDGGSGGNIVFSEIEGTFQVNLRPGTPGGSPPPPPPPPPPTAVPGGGGGGGGISCPINKLFTPTGCITACPIGFVYSITASACVPLGEFLVEINITGPFTTIPPRVNRIFLPFKFYESNQATYQHQLLANKAITNCSSAEGKFKCELSGVNTVIITRVFNDTNYLG